MDEADVEGRVRECVGEIEDAVHGMMKDVLAGEAERLHVDAALLAVCQNAAALPLARLIQAHGMEFVAGIATELLQKIIQRACDFAGVKGTVVIVGPQVETRRMQ